MLVSKKPTPDHALITRRQRLTATPAHTTSQFIQHMVGSTDGSTAHIAKALGYNLGP